MAIVSASGELWQRTRNVFGACCSRVDVPSRVSSRVLLFRSCPEFLVRLLDRTNETLTLTSTESDALSIASVMSEAAVPSSASDGQVNTWGTASLAPVCLRLLHPTSLRRQPLPFHQPPHLFRSHVPKLSRPTSAYRKQLPPHANITP